MLRNLLCYCVLTLTLHSALAQNINLLQANGWAESASITWTPREEAQSYNVYYSGAGIFDQKIDDALIRNYGDYFRADIPGLQAGVYTIAVAAVIDGTETTPSVVEEITVTAHDRAGFAFSNNRVPGAYKPDGTLKHNAAVIYITENTKNTVSLHVIGASNNPCVGLQNILDGFKKGQDNRPLAVRFIGQITDFDYMLNGDIVIENKNNPDGSITLEGVGEDATADGWGIRLKNASNIEIRNLATMNCNSDEGDNIGLQQDNDHIWVHHNDFFYGDAGGDADQAKGDGALDCKRSTYVTFSYNHFWDTGKSNLLGLNENTTEGLYITYHHNWYDHSDSRHPRVRFYSAHVYNNFYDGNSKYGVGATSGSSVFVENNYFRNCRFPMLISMQGSDVFDPGAQSNDYSDKPIFSKEDGGIIKAYGNVITEADRFVPFGESNFPNSTIDFDAYVTATRMETVPETVKTAYGNNTYNNFDTNNAVIYDYIADTPETAKNKVEQFSGRINGGDFKWEFNDAVDDHSSSVNAALKNALKNYKTSLVAVQGIGGIDDGGGEEGNGRKDITENTEHSFTASGMTSAYFDISGNLSDSKGTVSYDGKTLTQCLKIESSTSITFSTTARSKLTLVFNEDFSGQIKINGENFTIQNGMLSEELEAGTYEITKNVTANLYYISVNFDNLNTKTGYHKTPRFYPNPVRDQLILPKDLIFEKIEIYNMLGVLVKTESSPKIIDFSPLGPGSYLLKASIKTATFDAIIIKN